MRERDAGFRVAASLAGAAFYWLMLIVSVAHAAPVTIVNFNDPGEGFNDPTAVAPVGGNTGTTLGEQRLIAFQRAAEIWANLLEGDVEVVVDARLVDLECDATGAVLGAAGPQTFFQLVGPAVRPGTWYPVALVNQLIGEDADPALGDILAEFNSAFGTTCPLASGWYYGLDGQAPPDQEDFISVVLHELGHGFGFLSLVDDATGAKANGFDDIFMVNLENHNTLKLFPAMTAQERVTASKAGAALHWIGPEVVAASDVLTTGVGANGHVEMYAPAVVEPGSSVSHFSPVATPNQLMEPFNTGTHDVGLAWEALADIGWSRGPCTTAPRTDCQAAAAGKASLIIKDKAEDKKDQLNWTWKSSGQTATTDFGAPLSATDFTLCVYDGDAANATASAMAHATAPAGGTCGSKPCWKTKSNGFSYKDKERTPDGVDSLMLKAGAPGKGQITVKTKSAALTLPSLPLVAPVTVQMVRNDGGPCWEATFSSPKKNDTTQFNAKSD